MKTASVVGYMAGIGRRHQKNLGFGDGSDSSQACCRRLLAILIHVVTICVPGSLHQIPGLMLFTPSPNTVVPALHVRLQIPRSVLQVGHATSGMAANAPDAARL